MVFRRRSIRNKEITSRWYKFYLCPDEIKELSKDNRIHYNGKAFLLICSSIDALAEERWDLIHAILKSFNYSTVKKPWTRYWYKKHMNHIYALRWPELFYLTFECILNTFHDPENKCLAMKKMLEQFFHTFAGLNRSITNCPYELYITTCSVYALSHGLHVFVDHFLNTKLNIIHLNNNYTYLLGYYNTLCLYSKLLTNNTEDEYAWSSIYDRIANIILSAKDPQTMLGFIEPLLVSGQNSFRIGSAIYIVEDLCKKEISLLPYTSTILDRINLKEHVGKIIHEVVNNSNVDYATDIVENQQFLARFPLILYFVLQTSIKEDLNRNDAELNVRLLFEFLDHTTNRHYLEAWECMLINLEFLKKNFKNNITKLPLWIIDEWNERKTWWPKFHKVIIDNDNGERLKVFKILNKCIVNRKRPREISQSSDRIEFN